jgi:hypothetical protein
MVCELHRKGNSCAAHKPVFLEISVSETHGACAVCGMEEKWWEEHDRNNYLEYTIKMELQEIGWDGVDWIYLAQVTDK